jgi:hypothetical protein
LYQLESAVTADAVSIPSGKTDATIKTARTKDKNAILFVFFIKFSFRASAHPLRDP